MSKVASDTDSTEERIARLLLMPGSAARAVELIRKRPQRMTTRNKLVAVMIDPDHIRPSLLHPLDGSPSTDEVLAAMDLSSLAPLYAISEGNVDQQWQPAGPLLDEILRSGMATLMYHETGTAFLETEVGDGDRYLISPVSKSSRAHTRAVSVSNRSL